MVFFFFFGQGFFKMFWDSYIDNLVVQIKDVVGIVYVDRVCIIGIDGGVVWIINGYVCVLQVILWQFFCICLLKKVLKNV